MTIIHASFGFEVPVSTVSLKREKENEIVFSVTHTVTEQTLTIRFAKDLITDDQYIQIEDQVYRYEEILKNPERIYTLIQQDLLRDAIEELP